MEDNTGKKVQVKRNTKNWIFLEIEIGDCFVAFDDEEQCVDKCADVDNVLQDVIASLHTGDNSESDDDDIQCQPVTNAQVRKSLSLLH